MRVHLLARQSAIRSLSAISNKPSINKTNNIPWRSISQRRKIYQTRHHRNCEQPDNDRRLYTQLCILRWLSPRPKSTNRDRIVDGVRKYEVEDGTGDEGRGEMRRKVVVDEQLTVHEEEGEVVDKPDDNEEAGVVPETVQDGCKTRRDE